MITRPALDRRDARIFLAASLLLTTFFALAYVFVRLTRSHDDGLFQMFDLDAENNLPAWFSSLQLGLIAALSLLIASRCDSKIGPRPRFFVVAAAGFLFLSANEALGIHERITHLGKVFPWLPAINNSGRWMPVYGVLALVILIWVWRDVCVLWKIRPYTVRCAILGAATFLIGAVGLEIISYKFLRKTPYYTTEVLVEEVLEMVGAGIMLYSTARMLGEADAAQVSSIAPTITA